MMKKQIGFFISMLMISITFASANSVLENGEKLNIDINTITATIPVGIYQIFTEKEGHSVSIDNYGRLLIAGKPNLPSKIFSVAIPPGATIKEVTFETKSSIVIPGVYRIAPNSLPQVIGLEDPVLLKRDQQQYEENYQSVYGHNNVYPSSVGEIVGTGGYRKYNLIDVRINPISYYPLSGTLMYHPDISATIHYTFTHEFLSEDIMIDDLPQTEQIAKEIILNYDEAQEWYPTLPNGREQYNYVIITLDSLLSVVSPLADWESAKGKSVNVVTTSWINTNYAGYDLAAKMREFLREKYPSGVWGIEDVCLIGHYDDVPMRRTAQDQGYGQPETDYYYAELSLPDSQSWDANGNHLYGEQSDPIDFLAEINVGRIPWSDPETVQSICEKSVAFEQNSDESFKKNILLLAAFFWSDTDNAVLMEYKTNPANYPWMSTWTKTRLYEDAQSSYPCDYDLSYNNVQSVWSSGTYAFVNWAGHGSPTACYEYYPSQPFVSTDTCPHLDDNYSAIIFADACSNSDTDALNIGQAMLKRGAVGFLGATKVAYGKHAWDDPYDGSSQSLDCLFTARVTSGEYTQGAAHQWALRHMYVNNLWYYSKYEMFEWGALWGNPDLTMGVVTTSNPPATPSILTGPTHGIINKSYTFVTGTSDPDGDQIYYMVDWNDGTSTSWIGPYTSGTSVPVSHSWSELGSYHIKVKAKDTNGALSDWSEPLTITIVLNDAPNTPTITGPATGKPHTPYLYKLQTSDMNGDDVFYYIEWGDDTNSGWLGPYSSGLQVTATHSWSTKGLYTVKIKSKDVMGDESDWGTLDINMPKIYVLNGKLMLHVLSVRFPRVFFLLGNLAGF